MTDVRGGRPVTAVGDGKATDPWTVTEFQKRRTRTWRVVRAWIAVGIAGAIGCSIPFWTNPAATCDGHGRCTLSVEDSTAWDNILFAASFVAFGSAIIVTTKTIYRYYRCPKCETVPMRSSFWAGTAGFGWNRSIDPNPSACPNCGARLR